MTMHKVRDAGLLVAAAALFALAAIALNRAA